MKPQPATQSFLEPPHWTPHELQCAAASPGVSVIIPAYNAALTLEDAVESCFANTREPDQVVIVDDCSTDMTPQVIDDLSGVYHGRIISCRHSQNYGVSAARNHGARLAQYDLICYLDADDVCPPERVSQVERQLRCGLQMVYGQQEFFDSASWSKRFRKHPARYPTQQTYCGCGCGGSTISVRREVHTEAQVWWDEQMSVAEDAEFLLACLSAGLQVLCSENVYSWRRLSDKSLTHRGDWRKMREYMKTKHYEFLRLRFG